MPSIQIDTRMEYAPDEEQQLIEAVFSYRAAGF